MRSLRKNREYEGQNQELVRVKPLTAAEQNSQIRWFVTYRKQEKTSKKNGTYNKCRMIHWGPHRNMRKHALKETDARWKMTDIIRKHGIQDNMEEDKRET